MLEVALIRLNPVLHTVTISPNQSEAILGDFKIYYLESEIRKFVADSREGSISSRGGGRGPGGRELGASEECQSFPSEK